MKYLKLFCVLLIALMFQCKTAKVNPPPAPTASLLNTYWRLAEVNGEPLQTPPNVREVHMILTREDQENRLKGFAGCNNFGGSFTQNGNKLSFSAFSTKMMCPPDQMKTEDFLMKSLSATDSYEIDGETLSLLEGETELARFSAVYLKN